MKKILILLLTLSMGAAILCACKKQTMPVPEYPLDADSIDAALQEWGIVCTMQEDDSTRQGVSLYNMQSAENGHFIFGVLSAQKDGERLLSIAFPLSYLYNSIPAEECENAIAFATLLFGGFESTHQVYENFIQEYDTVNTEREENEFFGSNARVRVQEVSRWESIIGGTTCRIVLEHPTLSEPQEYLTDIIFASDWDTFFPEDTR